MPVTGLKVVIHHMLAIHPSLPPSHSAVLGTRLPGAFPAELQREWCLSVARSQLVLVSSPCKSWEGHKMSFMGSFWTGTILATGGAAVLCTGWDDKVEKWLGLGRMLKRMCAGVEPLGWM